MFAYCRNNPVCLSDAAGTRPCTVVEIEEPRKPRYDREAAVDYARQWSNDRNDAYYSYTTDCTNFTSQCLAAGGIPMTDEWHSYKSGSYNWRNPIAWFKPCKGYDWDVSGSWRLAKQQYRYFKRRANGYSDGSPVVIRSASDISSAAYSGGIQPGDLLYFSSPTNGIHHSTIITKVEGGMIYYAGHTSSCFDKALSEGLGGDTAYIIKITY